MRPKLFGCEFTYVQSDSDEVLTIQIDDEGGGKYYVIKTDRWSFDNISDLTEILAKVRTMISGDLE